MLKSAKAIDKNIHTIRVTFVNDFRQIQDQAKNKTYIVAVQLLGLVHFLAIVHHFNFGKWSVVILLRSFTFNNYQLFFIN
jgi:hypothetical protein